MIKRLKSDSGATCESTSRLSATTPLKLSQPPSADRQAAAALKVQAWWRGRRTRELPTAATVKALRLPVQLHGPEISLAGLSSPRRQVVEAAHDLRGKLYWVTSVFSHSKYGPLGLAGPRVELYLDGNATSETRKYYREHGGVALPACPPNAMMRWLNHAPRPVDRYNATQRLFEAKATLSCIDFVYLVLYLGNQVSKTTLRRIYAAARNATERDGDQCQRMFGALAGAKQQPLLGPTVPQAGDVVFLQAKDSGLFAHSFVYAGRDTSGRHMGIGLWNIPRHEGHEYPRAQACVIPSWWLAETNAVFVSLDTVQANIHSFISQYGDSSTRDSTGKKWWRELADWWSGEHYFN